MVDVTDSVLDDDGMERPASCTHAWHCSYLTCYLFRSRTQKQRIRTCSVIAMAPTALILPALSSLEACADWSLTVEPYIPYLKQLPSHFVESITGHGFKAFYLSMNPLVSAFALSLLLAPIFLVVSEVNKNYSQVDRCWSLLPTVYNAHYMIWAHMQGLPTHKLDYIFVFSCIWSVSIFCCDRSSASAHVDRHV